MERTKFPTKKELEQHWVQRARIVGVAAAAGEIAKREGVPFCRAYQKMKYWRKKHKDGTNQACYVAVVAAIIENVSHTVGLLLQAKGCTGPPHSHMQIMFKANEYLIILKEAATWLYPQRC